MSGKQIGLGFHMSNGLFFKRVDNGIQISKNSGKEGSEVEYQQVESLDSIASALASCTTIGDTAEQHRAFRDLLSS